MAEIKDGKITFSDAVYEAAEQADAVIGAADDDFRGDVVSALGTIAVQIMVITELLELIALQGVQESE